VTENQTNLRLYCISPKQSNAGKSYFWFTMKNKSSVLLFIKHIVTVIAAYLCGYYFTSFFHEPTSLFGGLWAAISAIIVLEASHKETYTSAINRITGTLTGAVVSGIYS